MPAAAGFIALYFPLFLLGAVFGKLMDDSGAAWAIADSAVAWLGEQRAILAVVLSCALLTYGGVSLSWWPSPSIPSPPHSSGWHRSRNG